MAKRKICFIPRYATFIRTILKVLTKGPLVFITGVPSLVTIAVYYKQIFRREINTFVFLKDVLVL